jgi:hypothetical protein
VRGEISDGRALVVQCVEKATDIIMPENLVAGDVMVLTKPLGTQVAVNLAEWCAHPPARAFPQRV